jgi:hypothetical protein
MSIMQSPVTVINIGKTARTGKSSGRHSTDTYFLAMERQNLTLHGIPLGFPHWVCNREGKPRDVESQLLLREWRDSFVLLLGVQTFA